MYSQDSGLHDMLDIFSNLQANCDGHQSNILLQELTVQTNDGKGLLVFLLHSLHF